MFAEFEKIIHEMEEAGEALTLDSFRTVYRGLLDTYFGPDFALDPELGLDACASRISTARSMFTSMRPECPRR